MRVNCSALWPPPEVSPLNFWGAIAGKLGATTPFTRPFLIGMRGVEMGASETHQPVHKPFYKDTFVLLAPNDAPLVFPGSTTAYQAFSKASPDVDGDGLGDVGSIRCGRYVLHYMPGQALGPIFHVKLPTGSDRIPCWRDTDHSGVISEAEAKRSEEMRDRPQTNSDGCYAVAVLFHAGYTSGKSSIACQTCSKSDLEAMKRAGTAIDYVLVNAWDVVPIAEEVLRKYGGDPDEATVPSRRIT